MTIVEEPKFLNTFDITRRPLYIPAGETSLFGWIHTYKNIAQRNCVAIICPPMGYEYTHSHRSVRHLCDELAVKGIPALRFDYHGTGDSPGEELDPDRIERWKRDIACAIQFAKQITGCEECCVIGLRLGGTLAASITKQVSIDYLVLWNAPTRGSRYVRELTAAAASSTQSAENYNPELIESGGFLINIETANEIKKLDLINEDIDVRRRVLIADRDDLPANTDLGKRLLDLSIATDQLALPGYAEMMAEPQFTAVPHQAIQHIVSWLLKQNQYNSCPPNHLVELNTYDNDSLTFNLGNNKFTEQPYFFGKENQLFGILTTTKAGRAGLPTVVLLSSGTVHHTGPGRLYVKLARELAANGFNCFRADLGGIGDSVLQNSPQENHPYPDFAEDNARSTLDFLKNLTNSSEFILLGLCSGAHTAFHTGILETHHKITDIIAINPLTYRWVEGMTLFTTQHFQDVEYYKNSVKSLKSWKKLLGGKVDIGNLVNIGAKQLSLLIQRQLKSIHERLTTHPTTELAADLKALADLQRPLSLFIATGDPGYNLLIHGAGHYAKRAIRSGHIQLQYIANADHTFSRQAPRLALIQAITEHLVKHRMICELPT